MTFEEKMANIIASMQAPECQRGEPTLDKLVLQNDLPAIIRELSSLLQREKVEMFLETFVFSLRWFKVLLVLNYLKFSLSHEYRNGLQHVEVIATFPRI